MLIEKAIPLGGTPLSIKVVASETQPESPKENTIWVQTDVTIGTVFYSVDEPTSVSEHDVWVRLYPSPVTATIAKNVFVSISSVLVYVNNSFERYPSKLYDGQEWVNIGKYLYYLGEQYDDVTGGFGAGDFVWYSNQLTSPQFMYDKIRFTNQNQLIGTGNPINTQGYNYLALNLDVRTIASNGFLYIGTGSSKNLSSQPYNMTQLYPELGESTNLVALTDKTIDIYPAILNVTNSDFDLLGMWLE